MDIIQYVKDCVFDNLQEELTKRDVKVVQDDTLYLLMYKSLAVNFNDPIIEQCRGVIFEKNSNKCVCMPYNKFYNFGDPHAPTFNLFSSTTRFYDKVDGSLIKLFWYKDQWNIASNGCIDAKNAKLSNDYNLKQLVEDYLSNNNFLPKLDTLCTYFFELTSPYNKVVIDYKDVSLTFLGGRNMVTLKEFLPDTFDIGVDPPKQLYFESKEQLKEYLDTTHNIEGVVAVNTLLQGIDYKRVKIKSKEYVLKHQYKDKTATIDDLLIAYLQNEDDVLDLIKQTIPDIVNRLDTTIKTIIQVFEQYKNLSRKEFAMTIKDKEYKVILFKMMDTYTKNNITLDYNQVKQLIGSVKQPTSLLV